MIRAVLVLLLPSLAIADKSVAVDVTASSTAKAKADKFAAWRAVDGSTGTAWCEGKDDEGVDETITLTLAEPLEVTRLDLYVGLHGSAKEYGENNQPSKISARTAPKKGDALVGLAKGAAIVSKYDTLVKLDLKTPRTIQVLEVGLAGVTRGSKLATNNTCISDISLVADKGQVISFLYGIPPDGMAQLGAAINVLRTAVANCDEKVLGFAVAYPFEHRVEAEEASKTIKHKDVKSLLKACKKGTIPAIPLEADKPEMSAAGLGRVSIEGGSEMLHLEMQWLASGWRLAKIETH